MKRVGMFCLALLLTACAGVGMDQKPQVALAGLELDEFNLFEQRFMVTLRVTNPNDASVTVDGVEFNLEVNGEHFASGVGKERVTLPRLGDALVKLRVSTNISTLWKQIRAVREGDKALGYRMTGKLFAPWVPGGIPFDRKGELPALKQLVPALPGMDGKKPERL